MEMVIESKPIVVNNSVVNNNIENMDFEGLSALKLEWLTYAHNEHICRKVVEVTRTFGVRVDVPLREHHSLYEYRIGNLVLLGKEYEDAIYDLSLRRGYRRIWAAGFIGERFKGDVFMNLAYEEGYADFPVKGNFLNNDIESQRVFIPGKWVDILNEKYAEATKVISAKVVNEKEKRAAFLAKQLLVDPRISI